MSCMPLNDIRSFDRPSASRRKTTARCEVRSVSSKSGQRDAYSTPSFFYAITVHASATVRSHHGTPDVIIVRLAKRPETRRKKANFRGSMRAISGTSDSNQDMCGHL